MNQQGSVAVDHLAGELHICHEGRHREGGEQGARLSFVSHSAVSHGVY